MVVKGFKNYSHLFPKTSKIYHLCTHLPPSLLHKLRELSHFLRQMKLALAKKQSDYTVYALGQDEGYTVKYNPLPEGVPEGEARGNS